MKKVHKRQQVLHHLSRKRQKTFQRMKLIFIMYLFDAPTKMSIRTKNLTNHHNFLFKRFLILVFASTTMPMMRMSNCLMFVPSLSSKIINNIGSNTVHTTFPKKPSPFSPVTTSNILSMSLRAWTCHGASQREMVEKLSSVSLINLRINSKLQEPSFIHSFTAFMCCVVYELEC